MVFEEKIRISGIQCVIPDNNNTTNEIKVSDVGYVSAKLLLDSLKWEVSELGVLILVTQGPDFMIPSTAALLQKRLQIGYECLVYDLNMGGDGFAKGLMVAARQLTALGSSRKGIVIFGDVDKKNYNSLVATVAFEVDDTYKVKGCNKRITGTFELIQQKEKYIPAKEDDSSLSYILNSFLQNDEYVGLINNSDERTKFISNKLYIYEKLKKEYIIDNQKDIIDRYSNNSAIVPYILCLYNKTGKISAFLIGAGISLSYMEFALDKNVILKIMTSKEYNKFIKEEKND